jgi:NAD(P)-dependent dehydrogenase (short-subunit alcohol dehydrogenase family)
MIGQKEQIDVADAHTAMPSLSGKRVAISGGTTGIGRAIAVLLASEGAQVFVCGRNADHLTDALQRIAEVGSGQGIALDLAEDGGCERFFGAADEALGGLDIAVINAAVPAEDALGSSSADVRYQLETDFFAYVICAKEAASRMEQGGGDIVFIGSMSAVSQAAGSSVYVAAKAGVQGFAASLREELADKNIKVGLVEPGFTGADFQYPDFPPERQRQEIEADRMLRAEDIAVAVHYMLTQPRRTAVSLIRVETRLEHK